MGKNINVSIECRNVAPLSSLSAKIQTSDLKLAIFAQNGNGKTYLSRMFRLLEGDKSLYINENGDILTNYLLSFGTNQAKFAFQVANDKQKIEDVNLEINRNKCLCLPSDLHYIYHTFNQDYVEQNIQRLDYVYDESGKNSSLQGYILGKAAIDIQEDKKKQDEILAQGNAIKERIQQVIDEQKNIIKSFCGRLGAFSRINLDNVVLSNPKELVAMEKTTESYICDFDKIKSVPEALEPLKESLITKESSLSLLQIKELLKTPYSLSKFSDEFKEKIKNKQTFIETGLDLLKSSRLKCPFCEQTIGDNAQNLIDSYTSFLTDKESQVIKSCKLYKNLVEKTRSNWGLLIKSVEQTNIKIQEYSQKYFSSLANLELVHIKEEAFNSLFDLICSLLERKTSNISKEIMLEDKVEHEYINAFHAFCSSIDEHNQQVRKVNEMISHIKEESKSIRESICRSTFNDIVVACRKDIYKRLQLLKEYEKISKQITEKESKEKVKRKEIVANTIDKILSYFFSGTKYTLDRDNFQLIFESRKLESGEVKHVLSEGEKNIIAFAYYLGDAHLKIKKEEDYDKLFFIIDDPISSMDYDYVYTVSGVIRHIKNIFDNKIAFPKYLILTHNNDFMRILSANKVVTKTLLLQNGNLKTFSENFTVPYVSHLLDIYAVSKRLKDPSHTTSNSIRHILETLVKFEKIDLSEVSIDAYIEKNFDKDKDTYLFINDLSHGGWRSEQVPLTEDKYIQVCTEVIEHINSIYPDQIEYCRKHLEK